MKPFPLQGPEDGAISIAPLQHAPRGCHGHCTILRPSQWKLLHSIKYQQYLLMMDLQRNVGRIVKIIHSGGDMSYLKKEKCMYKKY